VDGKGNLSPARLSVRVTQDLTSAIAGGAVEQTQTSGQMLSLPPVASVPDALTNISNTVLNQQNLVTSFDSLMKKLEVLVKVGDEVAKVCSLVSSPYCT
jgi:hypothetical protein